MRKNYVETITELRVEKHSKAITFGCPVANHITVSTKFRAGKSLSYHHLSGFCYLVTELLRPLKCFCCVSSLKASTVVYASQFYVFLH